MIRANITAAGHEAREYERRDTQALLRAAAPLARRRALLALLRERPAIDFDLGVRPQGVEVGLELLVAQIAAQFGLRAFFTRLVHFRRNHLGHPHDQVAVGPLYAGVGRKSAAVELEGSGYGFGREALVAL